MAFMAGLRLQLHGNVIVEKDALELQPVGGAGVDSQVPASASKDLKEPSPILTKARASVPAASSSLRR